MLLKTTILLSIMVCCESVYVYSSFWAPLFNPRILNYRVDSTFDPNAGKNARGLFEENYGHKGENLIADLGNGKGPGEVPRDTKMFGDISFYYTYPGANNNQLQ